MTLLATIVVLGVLIFVHELGHFLAARSVGIRVERFSLGLGPKVFGFRRGETEYVLSAIPLGGYVKMGGMDDEVMESIEGGGAEKGMREGAPAAAAAAGVEGAAVLAGGEPTASRKLGHDDFDSKPVWARAWVISAGVVMNMIFAVFAFVFVAAWWGSGEYDTTRFGGVRAERLPPEAAVLAAIPSGATLVSVGGRQVEHWGDVRDAIVETEGRPVTFVFTNPAGEVSAPPLDQTGRERIVTALDFWTDPIVDVVTPGAPAQQAGLQSGDRIVAVNGTMIQTWSQFVALVQASPEVDLEIAVERDRGMLSRTVTPDAVEQVDPATGVTRTIGQIGVVPTLPDVVYSRLPLLDAVHVGFQETRDISLQILDFLRKLVTGEMGPRSLGSLVTIGEASGQAAAAGLPYFIRFMGLFSINLAILNLLPIPVLDGGHLVFLGIEAVRGRPLSMKQSVRWSQVGFVFLMGVMVLALGNDILRLFGL
jgi:regulator of sigma E protease